MESKLGALMQKKTFALESTDIDTGFILFNEDYINYVTLHFDDRVEVYMELFDFGEEPYRDILAIGKGETLDEAETKAMEHLIEQAYKIH